MAEYNLGFEFIREPDSFLPEGSEVRTHTHAQHHNTHLDAGLWEAHREQPIVGADGKQAVGADGEPLWYALPVLTIQGGGPRSVLPIPANMRHRFVLLEDPLAKELKERAANTDDEALAALLMRAASRLNRGFYRCVFAHRDAEGKITEHTQHYTSAYV